MRTKLTTLAPRMSHFTAKIALISVLGLWTPGALADVVTLVNGNQIEGLITQQNETSIVISTPAGSMMIPMARVASVTKGEAWEFHIAQGDQLFQQGRLERALESYNQARALATEADALDEDLEASLDERVDAVHEQFTLLSAQIFKDVLERVDSFVEDRLYDQAFQVLQEAIDGAEEGMPVEVLQDAQARVLLEKAQRLLDMVNHRDAIAQLRRATELDPDLMEAHRLLGKNLANLNRTDTEAIHNLTIAISLMDEDTPPELISETQHLLAQCLQDSGRNLEASEAFKSVYERTPSQFPYAQRRMVDNVLRWVDSQTITDSNYDDVVAALTGAYEFDTNRVEPLNKLVTICQQRGQITEALRHCRRSLQIESNQASMHETLGDLILAEDSTNRVDAETAYITALRFNPNIYSAHCSLAALLERAGEYDQALEHCDAAIGITDQFARAFMLRGKTLISQDMEINADRAIVALREAIAKSTRYIEPHLLLGEIYIHKQDYRTAREQYENAIELISESTEFEDEDVQRLIADCHLGLGRIHLIRRAINQARDQANQALFTKPDYSWAHSLIGQIEEANGNYEAAETAFKEAIESEPTEPQFYYQLGLIYYRHLEMPDKAAENFCQYLSQGGADFININQYMSDMGRSCE